MLVNYDILERVKKDSSFIDKVVDEVVSELSKLDERLISEIQKTVLAVQE